ncbi:MAG: hypothetical protein KF678_11085 [Phycisphaeraceae bacterium]|nr:hypothetical protein [Phycisphaeraceae bacterium]
MTTRASMIRFLVAHGFDAQDLQELSDEALVDQYETERASLEQAEAEERYRSLRPAQRIRAGIGVAADVATVLADALRERGVPLRDLSAGSYYLGTDDARIRLSDHDPRPTYERAFGRSHIDVNTSPVPRAAATHEAGTLEVEALERLAGTLADWFKQRTAEEDDS